jgi:hypothetical protein
MEAAFGLFGDSDDDSVDGVSDCEVGPSATAAACTPSHALLPVLWARVFGFLAGGVVALLRQRVHLTCSWLRGAVLSEPALWHTVDLRCGRHGIDATL